MRQNWRRDRLLARKLLATILLLALCDLLIGCNRLSLTYNWADWILFWKIDQYFEVSSHQKPLLETRLTHFHSWHRKEEIPRYVSFLRTIHHHWQNGLTSEELDDIFHRYQALRTRLGSRLASDSAEFLDTLNPAQIQHLEEALQIEHQELMKEVGKDSPTRKIKRIESVMNWLEQWLGSLTPLQEQAIANIIEQFPDSTDPWLEYRVHRQHEFITLLKSQADSPILEQQIREWLVTPEKGAPPSYVIATRKREPHLKAAILTIDEIVTLQQREYASQKLQELIQELNDIASTE